MREASSRLRKFREQMSERLQKSKQCLLFSRLHLFECLGDVGSFAAVAQDGIEKRDGGAVMHQAGVQTDTPERRGANLVGGVVEFGDGEILPGVLVHSFSIMLDHGLDDAVACTNVME